MARVTHSTRPSAEVSAQLRVDTRAGDLDLAEPITAIAIGPYRVEFTHQELHALIEHHRVMTDFIARLKDPSERTHTPLADSDTGHA